MGSPTKKRVLFSSVIQPFGAQHGDGFGVSYEGSHQLMWAQGIFRPRTTTTQWGIDFIAHNLQAPTTTLHYPTLAQFIAELRKGYDYVGIAFIAATVHKMIPMVEAARRHAPKTKIVLGGYGTAMGAEVDAYADHVCRGEGVAFMRELLGERVDAPIEQPVVTQTQPLFSRQLGGRLGYVFAGLGCPNGCDFCATSAYFKRRHIRFLPDGESILRAMERLRDVYPDMTDFWINDEDFLLNEKRGRGFLEAIRRSDLPPLALAIFSSPKALSKFTASELVEMGVDWVWVGYEAERAGYSKMEGRPYRELFADFHRHGISVLASMIIGYDYQTPEIIEAEFDELMSLRPSMTQFLIYGPAHGTPLYERMAAEGRLIQDAFSDSSKKDGFSLGFEHPHIGPEEMVAIQRRLYRQAFERLGPSIYRVAEDWLTASVTLKDHPAPRARAKGARLGEAAHQALLVGRASKRYMGREAAVWTEELMQRLEAETGPLTLKERLMSKAAPALLWHLDTKRRLGIGEQPTFTRRTYRQEPQTSRRFALGNGLRRLAWAVKGQ